ncbi:putative carboxylesterase [Xylariomycetidae sp. FL2044]|nr:putative carboxylesterase [Xylariomycetidae sp. FL2044]
MYINSMRGNEQVHVLTAQLDYGTFQGAYDATYNISYWQKIPFAAPPVGENRFRTPQPPLPITNGTYNSTQPFDMCPQRTVNGTEDCLYLSLYSRPWHRPDRAPRSILRPVVVTFYGGGFIQGSASITSLPPPAYPILNASSTGATTDVDLVFVYANYRTNAFGFLPGRQVAADGGSDANAGLLDQRAVLRWVRRHVEAFGGDPHRVSVWGQSAGGGSVVAQVLAAFSSSSSSSSSGDRDAEDKERRGEGEDGDEDERPLFTQALASSPFWPKTYAVDSPEAQERYDVVANLTGCAAGAGDDSESLRCLKRADVQAIRDASLAVVDMHKYDTTTFGWGPVIDGVFLKMPLSEMVKNNNKSKKTMKNKNGKATIQYGFSMYNEHEGEDFVPSSLLQGSDNSTNNNETSAFDAWLAGYLPAFSARDLDRVREVYGGGAAGNDDDDDAFPSSSSSFSPLSLPSVVSPYERAGLIYRDTVLACPGYWTAGTASASSGGRSWLGEYTIAPAKHASDVYWWNTVNSAQVTDPLHYQGYAGAMASFFMTGDPNALKLTADTITGVPNLESGEQFVINSEGFTTSSLAQLEARCKFWEEMAPKIPI